MALSCGAVILVAAAAGCRDRSARVGDLTALADEWGTDKGTRGHHYTEVYDRFFSPIRQDARKVLEIGVLKGASLRMWRDYFPHAMVYGIDIEDTSSVNSDRIRTYVADQANRKQLQAFLDAAGSDFDLILDDGGHTMEQQQVSFGYLFRHVKPGGYYVIEDVHTSLYALYHDEFGATPGGEGTTLAMIDHFVRTGTIESSHMTPEEKDSFKGNIVYANLLRQENGHSIACIFRKKGPQDERGKRPAHASTQP
ncbi:MAG TPA: class I SAM-dependent methyltransferase [Vicinamibacteria bacterium]|nr:class I SAM-dependent methyltransferase [Vicinamibacteria bacterium]